MKKALHILTLIIISASVSGQEFIIGPGAIVTTTGGNIILEVNLTNDGTLNDTEGTFVFAGTNQTVGGSSESSFNNITVTGGSAASFLSPQKASGIVKVNGTLHSGGFLTLASTATSTACIDGSGSGQVTGNVTMQRYLSSGFGYRYISSPFNAATVSELGDEIDLNSAFPLIYGFNENRYYSVYPLEPFYNYSDPANILEPMRGYAINTGSDPSPLTIDITGVVNNGAYTIPVYNHNHPIAVGRNLVGNPYPSPIDWCSTEGWTKTNVDDALFYFRASDTDEWGGTYSSWIQGVSSDGIASNIIPSMQGFLVHVTDGTYPVSGTLSMNNSVRIINNSQPFIRKSQSLKSEYSAPLMRFTASFSDNAASSDFAVIYFDPKATFEFDGQLDAMKFMNTDQEVPNMYFITPADRNLSIYALPPVLNSSFRIPVGIKTDREGTIIIKIRDIDPSLYNVRMTITDVLTGTDEHLLPGSEYRVLLQPGEYRDRFFLNMSDIVTSGETSIDNEIFTIYCHNSTIYTTVNDPLGTDATLMITNLLGQTLLTEKIPSQGSHELNINLKDGIYVATLISGKFRTTKKFSIRN